MFTCAECQRVACTKGEMNDLPLNCPMRTPEIYEDVKKEFKKEENQRFYATSAEVEHEGYLEWPRVRETIEFAKRMGYKKIGVAFCIGLKEEAAKFCALARRHGLETVSAICCNGSLKKGDLGVPCQYHFGPNDVACNPIGQAELMKRAGTEFNVVIGLCVGHDSLFLKYSHVMTTVLICKDRVTGHNPAAALYGMRYLKKRLEPQDK